ncbi:protein downstream neighbor of son homolog [Cylas formicarius]|uniref:protein downstream neighbor of son homolog n=1 Tax=Cylas formicarius TaxID=197179 RepID=UPI002958CB0E|nr:protein downstream neighbor of son homolog [Cylas formicarius]
MMPESSKNDIQWHRPADVMKLHKLKQKKKALQARINGNVLNNRAPIHEKVGTFKNVFSYKKRKNPFRKESVDGKKRKVEEEVLEESTDQTLFKLLNQSSTVPISDTPITSFSNILDKLNSHNNEKEHVEVVKATGKLWLPIDWSLKTKMRLISMKPFLWTQNLKVSEEASGITSFTRCLDVEDSDTTLDASPNAKFHNCCLFWQHPFLPWLTLFPRNSGKGNNGLNLSTSVNVKNSLFMAWKDSFRSLFQLLKTKHCPYFYMCTNNFNVLFRAGGISGYTDLHALVTPTTRGFRQMLRQEDIEFVMPLKKRNSDQGYETLDSESCTLEETNEDVCEDKDDEMDEHWLKKMGISAEDIKQINYNQARIKQKVECQVDNSNQSLIFIEGVEVNGLFNFLINCKSTVATTGTLAGIPPTLLAPVSFQGATLNSLKVRQTKILSDGSDFYCLELLGPILPSTVHNIFSINSPGQSMTVTFNNLSNTEAFSKAKNDRRHSDVDKQGAAIFSKENLSDCGLRSTILKHFCSANEEMTCNIECLKYCQDNCSFTWT